MSRNHGTDQEGPKKAVVDDTPMQIGAIEFGVMPANEIQKQSQIEVSDRNLYDLGPVREPSKNGPLDRRLGIGTKGGKCKTCSQEQRFCNGHWGFIRLEAPCFHIGFLDFTISILNQICKSCSRVLLLEPSRRAMLKSLRRPLDSWQKKSVMRSIQRECKAVHICSYCHASNGPVRKAPNHACKLVHLKYEHFNRSTAKSKVSPADKQRFDGALDGFSKTNPENAKYTRNLIDDLPAIKVYRLFCNIPTEDCPLLGLNINNGRPESYIWTYLPVPPPNIRPSVPGDQGTTEDELTTKLSEIIDLNTRLRIAINREEPMGIQMEYYEKLQDHLAMYINSNAPGLNKSEYGKAIRSFCSRLKGKQGRFRGNLSGKRVNYSARTVISPDPNLSIEEVGIPMKVAKVMSYPEVVTRHNFELMKETVRNGSSHWPGANSIWKSRRDKNPMLSLRGYSQDGPLEEMNEMRKLADELQIGDIVHRHLRNGDLVLFNRQPSLHKLSILCHRVRVHSGRTFRFNESVCTPYNADFDGDEMNVHVPQTEEARAEALALMGVKHNLVTPKNGAPIIAPIQDFITGAYLLSNKDEFFNRAQFSQMMCWMFDATTFKDPDSGVQGYELPPPAIQKPMYLWTGKQIFNVLMRPSKECKVLINVEAKLKQYKHEAGRAPELSVDDAYLIVRNSEVMCGVMDRNAIGDGKKTSLFFVMLRDYGEDYAVQGMNRLAKLTSRWLAQRGFSVGIGDVYPSARLESKKKELILSAYGQVENFIALFRRDKLRRDPGCDEEQTLENKISKILSDVRQKAGQFCFDELSPNNAAVIMAKSGSKGSMINVSQMTAGVGQQMISQKRVENGFQDRTLPHFAKGARDPSSKGFVSNSFFSGLAPTEFFFHAMSGREGLVDTAVKTAETGYMSRRLIKSLEDAYIVYDKTVRNSLGTIIQFSFGDDFLDPAQLEGDQQPVNFERTFAHAVETTRDNASQGLSPSQIQQETRKRLDAEFKKLIPQVYHEDAQVVSRQSNELDADCYGGVRTFVSDINKFLDEQVSRLERLRANHQMDSAFVHPSRKSRVTGRGFTAWLKKRGITSTENQMLLDNVMKITPEALQRFLDLCFEKYEKSVTQPGHAVGAIAAQSIGEPGTQMTLKTFHFAGVAGMSITQGVPRIKEIINATKKISTPVITCSLENKKIEIAAQTVKSHIEKTYLRDIASAAFEKWNGKNHFIRVKVDMEAVARLQLEVTLSDIARAIARSRHIKVEDITISGEQIDVTPENPAGKDADENDGDDQADYDAAAAGSRRGRRKRHHQSYFQALQDTLRHVENVVVKGYPDTSRAIIRRKDTPDGEVEHELLVEGYGLRACMNTPGVDGRHTSTNSVMEVFAVLGIEAARGVIISEIQGVMESMDIDVHHIDLLACIMTVKGEVLGITRFGMVKMGDSVLQLASFEKTPDHLFEAATRMKSDPIAGVSESIIMGQTVKLGTGAASVVQPLGLCDEDMARKTPVFSAAVRKWVAVEGWDDWDIQRVTTMSLRR